MGNQISILHFDEASGASLRDELLRYNGTATGTTVIAGQSGFGNARRFTASSSHRINFSDPVIPRGSFVVKLKVRVATAPSSVHVLFATGTTSTSGLEPGICLYIYGTDRVDVGALVVRVITEDLQNLVLLITKGLNICNNQWHDVKIVNDNENGTLSIIVDNINKFTADYTPGTYPTTYGRNLVIGCMHSLSPNTYMQHFNGDIDEFEVWQGTEDIATVGDRLVRPENGWKRYDISDFSYMKKSNETVYVITNANAINGAYVNGTATTPDNTSIEFSFIGSKLRLIGSHSYWKSRNVKIKIDDTVYSFDQGNSIQQALYKFLVYEKFDLPFERHDVKIFMDSDTIPRGYPDNLYSFDVDAIDIDEDGRLFHPDEVTDLKDLAVGKRIRCHYQASSGQVGTFSGLGQETSNFIPAASAATPNGDFYFICVGKNFKGDWELVADRNVQHSISWDKINEQGMTNTGREISL